MASHRYIALLGLLLVGPACKHRAVVSPDDFRVRSDGVLILPDGPISIGPPEVCERDQVSYTTHQSGNFSLVLPVGVSVHPLTIQDADALDSAVALNATKVAGLAATRRLEAPESDPSLVLSEIQKWFQNDISAKGLGSINVRASGTVGKSAEGFSDVKEAIWDVTTAKPIEPGALRDILIAAVLHKDPQAISGLPGPVAQLTNKLVVRLTLATRPSGQIAVSGAVASQNDYDGASSTVAFLVDDLSNGTALGKAGSHTVFECDLHKISTKPVADLIWVIDESGSMNDNRQDIVNNAVHFFEKAVSGGLDFRMGVAGVKKPDPKAVPPVELGKFCSVASTQPSHDGGEDRFLLPHEQTTFQACVKNPPYYEGGAEHGLTQGYHAVKAHLPRAAGSPDKIRIDAHLAVIFVTDEAPQELKKGGELFGVQGFLSYTDYSNNDSCNLGSFKQTQLNDFLKPVKDLFSAAHANVHVIGGTCNNSCSAEIAYGYRELAKVFSGQLGDVCQKDLNATLEVIIDSITASASPVVLDHTPISSTLAVEANGVRLSRSRTQGFAYNAATNSLTFIKVKISKGNVVAASYRRFQ